MSDESDESDTTPRSEKPKGALSGMTPIIYRDTLRVVIAGPLGKPLVGIGKSGSADVPLLLTVAEARELAGALTWALNEYDARTANESFYPAHRSKGT